MKLLNLGCGYPRFEEPEWTNLDNLKTQLREGTPERDNLDKEPNYVEHTILSGPLPFENDEFDGVLASHVFEHFDCQESVAIMEDCRRILKPGGVLLVSVPNASHFRAVYPEDRVQNWPALFGQTDPENPIPTFFKAALWYEQHKAILTEDALWCYFVRAGFTTTSVIGDVFLTDESSPLAAMGVKLNRRKFSLEMFSIK